jgi:hypothetical protein
MRHVEIRRGNRHGYQKIMGPEQISRGFFAVSLRFVDKWHLGPDLESLKFQGARLLLAATRQPQAGSARQPVRPETAGDTPRILSSIAFQPDENPWDFNGCE